jgi:protein involved in polysaccharide export with SLBB domain
MRMVSFRHGIRLSGALAAALAVAGCNSTDRAAHDAINPSQPYAFPGQSGAPAGQTVNRGQPGGTHPSNTEATVGKPDPVAPASATASTLRVGDYVTIAFSDNSRDPLPLQKLQIGEDGSLTLPFNVRVQAVGKTPRALEQEIRGKYVPDIYRFLTVTVTTEQRAYYVGGEVKVPNRQQYLGEMTVLRAIQTAGDFTDFANRKKIELIRENGQRFEINWHKAIKDPKKYDLPVFPNDQIIVHKRIF